MGLFNITFKQNRAIRNELIIIYWYLKHAKISKQERTYLYQRLMAIEKNLPRVPAFFERTKWRIRKWKGQHSIF